MKQKTNEMTPNESLIVITEMINNLKEDYKDDAYSFILWGWTITLACITHFIIIQIHCRYEIFSRMGLISMVLWVAFVTAGFIIHYMHKMREAKHKPRNRSLYERFIKALWLAAGLNMVVIIFLCFKFEIYPPVLIMPIIGMATMIMGLMIRFKPIIAGGFIFFAATIIAAFWLYEYSLIVDAVAIILGYLVPGYLLKNTQSVSHV